ncbi:MAG: helix-turn-helix domain-containing protein [Acidimicrobiales bacterium]
MLVRRGTQRERKQVHDVLGRAGKPNDPLLRLGWAATALREHRGNGHVAALLTAVISPCEALVLAAAAAPRASARALEALPSTALDQPHDQRSARHRQQQSAGATQQQRAHEPAQERATDPDDHRHADAHRVGAGDD